MDLLTLTMVLEAAGIPPDETLVVRHTPKERSLRRVMPWLVNEKPNLFRMYQSTQSAKLEAAMQSAIYLAAFLEDGPRRAVFAGLYQIMTSEPVTYESFWAIPEHQELKALGMTGLIEGDREGRVFKLHQDERLGEWTGRLCIAWPGREVSWWRWAHRNVMPVTAIHAENAFAPAMPGWESIVVTWAELQVLPASWRAKLSEWRGIYYIFDTARRLGYVGSAYGQENILGRWRSYASTGHGGNARLRESNPADLRFSILQRTSPDMPQDNITPLETLWKARLHTRAYGLNSN